MATARRTGAQTSETRAKILDVTEKVMIEDGYAAVSSRRVAKEVGVTPALVHYYFATLDDLFLEVMRRRGRQQQARLERLLRGPQPLRALWSFSREQAGTALLMEFMSLAHHRKTIRKELAASAEQFRQIELDVLTGRTEEYGIDAEEFPLPAILVAIAGLSRTVVMEQALGIRLGLEETDALVERILRRYEGSAPEKPQGSGGAER